MSLSVLEGPGVVGGRLENLPETESCTAGQVAERLCGALGDHR